MIALLLATLLTPSDIGKIRLQEKCAARCSIHGYDDGTYNFKKKLCVCYDEYPLEDLVSKFINRNYL